MAGHRQDKLNNAVCLELAAIIREVKDPRVSGTFVSIVGANVSPDLSTARVFYSVLGNDDGVQKGLVSATGFIRSELAFGSFYRQALYGAWYAIFGFDPRR